MKSERLRLAQVGRNMEKAGKENPFKIYEEELIEEEKKLVLNTKSKGKK